LEASALYITVFAGVFIPAGQINNSSKNSKAKSKQRVGSARYLPDYKAPLFMCL
jgi:hypothetical protein